MLPYIHQLIDDIVCFSHLGMQCAVYFWNTSNYDLGLQWNCNPPQQKKEIKTKTTQKQHNENQISMSQITYACNIT